MSKAGEPIFPYWPAALRLDQAAAYVGLCIETFKTVCPVKPIAFTQSPRGHRYLRASLDIWLSSLDSNEQSSPTVRGEARPPSMRDEVGPKRDRRDECDGVRHYAFLRTRAPEGSTAKCVTVVTRGCNPSFLMADLAPENTGLVCATMIRQTLLNRRAHETIDIEHGGHRDAARGGVRLIRGVTDGGR
jgi:hypothetical protein